MELAVASGKGGTGKTMFAVGLVRSLAENELIHFLDCDVEEPNAGLFIKPLFDSSRPICCPIPKIDEQACTHCGRCGDICQFNALAVLDDSVLVFDELCHGCGACWKFCPEEAIQPGSRRIGQIRTGQASNIQFWEGRLDVGQVASPFLIRQLKTKAKSSGLAVIDAPPGTSCPVIESLKGSDFCILVTEPTPFGFHDLRLAVRTLEKMATPFGVVINRADIGDDSVAEYCREHRIPVLMTIPFDRRIAEAYSRGKTLVDVFPDYVRQFRNVYDMICGMLDS